MNKSNNLISFLRHYGPIPAGDNMYDELIQTEIEHYGIEIRYSYHTIKIERY
ncbi:Uncharacterised protein [Escherichia coli]|uniref:Uncharacterized protein n=1 Tax=Escherichia coli TaxID=562 RepID=A0A376TND7_ECOLX|nr:Uncharacterised protein [Escherichia coli]